MKVTYDPSANAAYIYLRDGEVPGGIARSEICDAEMKECAVILEFDHADRLVGIEILGARRLLSEETLDEATRT